MELIVFYFGFISLLQIFLSYRQIIKHNSINNSNFFIFIYYKSFYKKYFYPSFLLLFLLLYAYPIITIPMLVLPRQLRLLNI